MAQARKTTVTDAPDRAGGRPRDPAIDDAILDATRSLLVAVGYQRLSFDLVARRAKVSRPTIYRRWPSKAHLVHEAVFVRRTAPFIEVTGDLRSDVGAFVQSTLTAYARPEVRAALPGLIADLHDDDELRRSVNEQRDAEVRGEFRAAIAGAVERAEVPATVDPDAVFDMVIGTAFQRAVLHGDASASFAQALTNVVIDGIAPLRRPSR